MCIRDRARRIIGLTVPPAKQSSILAPSGLGLPLERMYACVCFIWSCFYPLFLSSLFLPLRYLYKPLTYAAPRILCWIEVDELGDFWSKITLLWESGCSLLIMYHLVYRSPPAPGTSSTKITTIPVLFSMFRKHAVAGHVLFKYHDSVRLIIWTYVAVILCSFGFFKSYFNLLVVI